MRITDIRITPVAIKDPPLLNSVGVHGPYALRSILEVETDDGLTGLGEAYGDDRTLARLRGMAPALTGLDPFDTNGLMRVVGDSLTNSPTTPTWDSSTPLIGPAGATKTIASTVAAFEVPCLDLQGKALGRPVADLLGGAVRDAVPYSAYLFYKWPGHPGEPTDGWGPALDPDGIVAQARHMVDTYGFTSLKLKGGVFAPEHEIEAVLALRDAFADHPLRIDPNTAWTVPTSIEVGKRLDGVLEYLEDPAVGLAGMAAVAAEVAMPLATNMCVTTFSDIPPAVELGSVGVVLADHHYWGGLRASLRLAGICETFGLGLSMHSNTHLGISLAAMTQLAAATPNLTYACDTHTPWQTEDVVVPGALRFEHGSVPLPDGPGLGVELDTDALGRLHEQWERCGIRRRDDVAAMRAVNPAWLGDRPRF